MASIEHRPSFQAKTPWRAQVRKKGFPSLQKSFKTKEEAEKWAFEMENSIDQQRSTGICSFPKFPLKVWIDRYKTEIGPSRQYWSKEIRYFDFWNKALGNELATEISPISIESHADGILKTVGKNGNLLSYESRRKYLLMLSSLYGIAIRQWKWAIYNPLTGVDMLRKKDREQKNFNIEVVPCFNELRNKFCELVKEKTTGLSQREASEKCGLSLHAYQYAIDPKNNITVKNFIKICNALEIKVWIE